MKHANYCAIMKGVNAYNSATKGGQCYKQLYMLFTVHMLMCIEKIELC
jgi:hypothetical protein